jgi:hypothetical protein
MDKKQKVNCNVCTCQYNNTDTNECDLKEIKVCACPGCSTGEAKDESMCASYKCNCGCQDK